MGKQNKLVIILATVVAILLFVFVGLAVNYYTSNKTPKEEHKEEIKVEAPKEIKPENKEGTIKRNVYNVGITETVFRTRFNQVANEELSDLGLHIKKAYIYSKNNISVYQAPFDNTTSLMISYETDSERLRGVVLMGQPVTDYETTTFLGAIADVVATLNPDLSPAGRGNLLKELGMFTGGHTNYKTINNSTIRNDILFKIQGSGGNGVLFYAVAKDIATTAGSSVSRDDPHNIMADITNFIVWDGENQKKGITIDKKTNNNQNDKKDNSYADVQKAEYALTNFHKNITDKEYNKAYNGLTKQFKNTINYDGWVNGFNSTVSSMVYDIDVKAQTTNKIVLKYILRAEDNPGGIKYFSGEATMVKSGDEWKIDRIENKVL